MNYPITEIFRSIQFEGPFCGTPAVFIRLSGCNMKCGFCDTDHSERETLTENEIAGRSLLISKGASLLVITGGEPLINDLGPLLSTMKDYYEKIQIETNGSQDISLIPDTVEIVCSPKGILHASFEQRSNNMSYKFLVSHTGRILHSSSITELQNKNRKFFFQPVFYSNEDIYHIAINHCAMYAAIFKGRVSIQTHKHLLMR